MDLNELLAEVERETAPIFRQMEIAQEETLNAQERHGEPIGEGAGPIWTSWELLKASHFPRPIPEGLYRQHVIEVLDRRAKGEDTRPATYAEMAYTLSEASLKAPLNPGAAGLYLKIMYKCFPEVIGDVLEEIGRSVSDYERLHGQQMAEYEDMLRKKLRQPWRTAD